MCTTTIMNLLVEKLSVLLYKFIKTNVYNDLLFPLKVYIFYYVSFF